MGKETLDPVTFEVLKNSFITSVDQMAEQVIRTVSYTHLTLPTICSV